MNIEALKEENARLHRDVGLLVLMLEGLQKHLDPEDATMLASIKARPGATLDEMMDRIMDVKG